MSEDIVDGLRKLSLPWAHNAANEIKRLREVLEFVRTDPCFHKLGSVTRDTVTDTIIGLTNILED